MTKFNEHIPAQLRDNTLGRAQACENHFWKVSLLEANQV